jgi:MFS transporter, DHA3 family, tetracycline resistance protein
MNDGVKVLICSFLRHFLLFLGVMLPLLISYGFQESEYFLFTSIFILSMSLFELPTGFFSDKYGAKTSILISSILFIVGTLIILIDKTFISFVVFNILYGMSYAFLAGSDMAILLDTNLDKPVRKNILAGNLGKFLGAIVSGVSISSGITYEELIVGQLVLSIIYFLVALSIKYKNGHHHFDIEKLEFRELINDVLHDKEKCRIFLSLAISVITFLVFTGSFQPILKLYQFKPASFAFIIGGFNLLQVMISLIGHHFKKINLILMTLGVFLCLIALLLFKNLTVLFLSIGFILIIRSIFFYRLELFVGNFHKSHIATYNSIFNFLITISFAIESYIMSVLTKFYTLENSLFIIICGISVIYFLLMKRVQKIPKKIKI